VWLLAARVVAAQAAQGIITRLNLPVLQPLLSAFFLLFLLLVGYTLIDWIGGARDTGVRQVNALPQRATAKREWRVGAVIGWGALLVAVLPMMFAGSLHPQFWFAPHAWVLAGLSTLALLIAMLAVEVGFRGFLFRQLIAATGPTGAAIVISILYATVNSLRPNVSGLSVVVTFVLGLVLSLAYLRTHALWLGWGLHFAWAAAMSVLFGLPLGGLANFSSVVSTDVSGPVWLTGGAYGPEGALLTMVVLAGTMAVVYRSTRDYAWSYTHPPIVPGGYAVVVQPPAAHAAMEQAPASPQGLVQILGATPLNGASAPVTPEHVADAANDHPA
jgi:uncharacterized protein